MRQGWEIKKLGEVCSIQLGKTPYRKNPKFWDKEKLSGNIWLSISDLKHGEYIFESAEQVTDLASKEMVKIPKGTMLLSFKLTLGRVSFAGTDLFTNEAIASLLTLNKKISKDFLFYYFSFFNWDKAAEGDVKVKGKTLNKQKLKELPIPLPPLPEQQRIVSILDEAFAAIAKSKANAEQNLKNAKELFESYLQGVFENKGGGWEEKSLGEIAFVKSGGTPLRHETEYWNGDIAWYSSGELNELFTTNPERHINESAIENSNAKLFPKGSLLIGMYDTAALKMSILDREGTFNQAIAGVKPNPKIDLIFILHAINAIKPEILNLRRGVRQKNLSLEKIKNIPIPLPSLKVQQTIVRQLDALRAETQKLEAVYQKKIDDLEELKKSILQKAFAGELKTEILCV